MQYWTPDFVFGLALGFVGGATFAAALDTLASHLLARVRR